MKEGSTATSSFRGGSQDRKEGGDCRQLRTYNVLFQGPLSVTLLYCKKQKATCTVSRVWKQCCTMYTYYYMYVALLPPFFLNLEVRLKGAFTWNIKFTRQYIYCHLTCPCLPTMNCQGVGLGLGFGLENKNKKIKGTTKLLMANLDITHCRWSYMKSTIFTTAWKGEEYTTQVVSTTFYGTM